MNTAYCPPLMITVDEAADLLSATPGALYGQISRGTSGLIVRRGGKTIRVSLKSVLAVAGMTLSEYIDWLGEAAGEPRTKIRGAA